jgi:hypothetical protein
VNLVVWYEGDELEEDGVVGVVPLIKGLAGARCRKGEAGLRTRVKLPLEGIPKIGEALRSDIFEVSSSIGGWPLSLTLIKARFGNPGNTSSAGFLGMRTRAGEPKGLAGL